MVVRTIPTFALLATALLAPFASAGGGTQTIYYVEDQAFLNLDHGFIAGDSGAGCYSLSGPSVGGCGYWFNVPGAAEGSAATLHLQDDAWFAAVGFHWRLVDGSTVCAEGDAVGEPGDAVASFTITGSCRVVEFVASGATAGTITLTWS